MQRLLAVVTTGMAALAGATGVASAQPPKPVITGVSASHVTAKSATISALIKPEGYETKWLIDVSRCADAECEVEPENSLETVATGSIAASSEGQQVRGSVHGWWVESGKTYTYQVIAYNGNEGSTEEVEGSFETEIPAGTPLAGAPSASGIAERSATLSATVEPVRSSAKWELWVEYQACGPYEECISYEQRRLKTGHVSKRELVSDTAKLSPGCEYSFWFVLANSAGRTGTRHESFETPGTWNGCRR